MVLDISKLINKNGASVDICEDIALETVSFGNQDITVTSPVHTEGDVTNVDGLFRLTLRCNADYVSQCSRCLADTEKKLDFKIEEVFSKTELENENDEVIILNSNEIDLKEITEHALCCALPITCLCSDDCKGLCPVCGCDLNSENCSCETDDIDPRLAALKDFLK